MNPKAGNQEGEVDATLRVGDWVVVVAGVYRGRSGRLKTVGTIFCAVKPDQPGVGGLSVGGCMVVGVSEILRLDTGIISPKAATQDGEVGANLAEELRMSGENARLIIYNAHQLLRYRYRRIPLWSLVADLTGHGSGYSQQICYSARFDPMQSCGCKILADYPPAEEQRRGEDAKMNLEGRKA